MYEKFFSPQYPEETDFTGRDPESVNPSAETIHSWYENAEGFVGDYNQYLEKYPNSININFEQIQSIFNEMSARTGVVNEAIFTELAGPERIFVTGGAEEDYRSGERIVGGAYTEDFYIMLAANTEGTLMGAARAASQFEAYGKPAETDLNTESITLLETLRTHVHEQIHMISGHTQIEASGLRPQGHSSGLKRNVDTSFGFRAADSGEHLDEGMTDLWTQEVVIEYLRREGNVAGVTAETAEKYFELSNDEIRRQEVLGYQTLSYTREIRLVKKLILALSQVLSVDDQQIKNAFLRAKLRSGTIFTEELRDYFSSPELKSIYEDLLLLNEQTHGRQETYEEKEQRFRIVEKALDTLLDTELYYS